METIKKRGKREERDPYSVMNNQSLGSRRISSGLVNILVVVVLGFTMVGCGPPGPRALLKGVKLLEQGKYADAVTKLETATSILTTNAQAWNYLGLACHYAGKPTEAEKGYQRALALDHDLSEAHYNLGCLWLEQSRPDAAKTELTAYVLRRGNSLDSLLKLGSAQYHSGDLNGAEKTLNDALRLLPENPDALNGLGLVRLQHRRAPEAAQFFARAVKQRPGYAPALLNLAIVHQQYLKDPQGALQEYRTYTALKPPPPNIEAVAAIARQLDEELNPPRAIPVESKSARGNGLLSAATSSNPDRIGTGIKEGESSPTTPSPKPQTNSVARTVTVPKQAPASNIAKVTSPATPPSTSKPETVSVSSEPVFKPARDVSDTSADASRAPAGTSTSTTEVAEPGQSTAAPVGNRYKYLTPAKPVPGDRAAAARALAQGTAAGDASNFPDAERAFRSATQLDPSYFEAQYDLASAAVRVGHLSTALGAYERALAINPDAADARYYFAMALKQANYPADAAHQLEKVLVVSPNETRAHFALGNLYANQLNQPGKARIHYQKVLDTEPSHPQAGKILYWMNGNPP